ncbi:uncharacterized protein A4U43_UnF8060 [Asparagus officinalis]|uniref:Uncharacterized protein n=1 Tax=Asparagus officinalis TaxID=4686 RepID=A0A1R3L615_ASPOF|nr:uncharacterized protein A4U43_UnF8060 [Asparagus officinalis]
MPALVGLKPPTTSPSVRQDHARTCTKSALGVEPRGIRPADALAVSLGPRVLLRKPELVVTTIIGLLAHPSQPRPFPAAALNTRIPAFRTAKRLELKQNWSSLPCVFSFALAASLRVQVRCEN